MKVLAQLAVLDEAFPQVFNRVRCCLMEMDQRCGMATACRGNHRESSPGTLRPLADHLQSLLVRVFVTAPE